MVHTKCAFGKRGKPTTEFYKDGKPQIYCYGWINGSTGEPLRECKVCPDFVYGDQIEKDFEKQEKICGSCESWKSEDADYGYLPPHRCQNEQSPSFGQDTVFSDTCKHQRQKKGDCK